jgi:hypothetical protein
MNNFHKLALPLLMVTFGAEIATAAANNGTAIVRVESDNPGTAANFVFKGVVNGSVIAGQSISESGLKAGAYTTWEAGGTPGQELVSIACDDANSTGYIGTRTARFIIDGNEAVECVFTYRQQEVDEQPSTQPPAAVAPPDAEQDSPPPPENTAEPAPEIVEPEACQPPDLVPREGVWMVSNLPGTMTCGAMTLPLTPSQEPGTLMLRDCGWTVVGSGFSEDTADLIMTASDQSGTRYTGTVGDIQDGIPMRIDFEWSLQTDSRITGSLHSEVSQQGMTCVMARDYEMNFSGN